MNTPEQSELGKPSAYADQYDASLLFPIARAVKRQEIGVGAQPPFFGADMWTAYELSWLNLRGKPQVALVQVVVPCETPNIVKASPSSSTSTVLTTAALPTPPKCWPACAPT